MRVAIIPARAGSKRIPGKNIRLFHGKPIIAYSIEVAISSGLFDCVFVSTDSEEIGVVAAQYGASVWERDPSLADDLTGTQAVAAEVMNTSLYDDVACVIYATAPLLSVQDLAVGPSYINSRETQFVFAVGTTPTLHDAGQFYWGRAAAFAHVPLWDRWSRMVPISPERDCDINVEEDWLRAEQMFINLRGGR